jgi:hypothetical protein
VTRAADKGALKLVVYCDNFHSGLLVGADKSDPDTFLTRLCGGSKWSVTVLKVVVLSRIGVIRQLSIEEAVFGRYRRRILLPFFSSEVERYLDSEGVPGRPEERQVLWNPKLLSLFAEEARRMSKQSLFDTYSRVMEQWYESECQACPDVAREWESMTLVNLRLPKLFEYLGNAVLCNAMFMLCYAILHYADADADSDSVHCFMLGHLCNRSKGCKPARSKLLLNHPFGNRK